jgi:hypothetical protein
MSQNGGLASLNGAVFFLAPQLSMSVLHRSYQKEYQSYYGNAFGESSKPANENGFFVGAEILPWPKWKLSGYFDTYSFPWLGFRSDAPSFGKGLFRPTRLFSFAPCSNVCKLKQEVKPENSIGEDGYFNVLNDVASTKSDTI